MNGTNVSGKQRASRIPLDYYKKPDRMTTTKRFWTRAAAVGVVVWLLTYLPASMVPAGRNTPLGNNRFSHGPVCKSHQGMGFECSACHVSFPMLGSREKEDSIQAGARSTFSGDTRCLECHLGEKRGDKFDGFLAVHHPIQLVSKTPNCGACHKEHQGANHDLRRAAQSNCLECHRDLEKALKGTTSYQTKITAFHTDHPDFRSRQVGDRGKLKFNHKYHMTEGIRLSGDATGFTVGQMKDGPQKTAVLGRVGSDPTRAVRLDCADCHKLDSRDDRAWVGGEPALLATPEGKESIREAFATRRGQRKFVGGELEPRHIPGAYMGPINYEQNCSSCHPLTIDSKGTTVPHYKQPDELRTEVEKLLAATPADPPPVGFFPLPGKQPGAAPLKKEARLDMVMRTLLEGKRTCGECHVSEDGSDLSISTKKIAKPDVPGNWLQHARFDHSEHLNRGMTCRECHANAFAYPDDSRTNWDEKGVLAAYAKPRKGAEDVLVPSIDKCKECHTPKPEEAKKQFAARSDCTECHQYHHGLPKK